MNNEVTAIEVSPAWQTLGRAILRQIERRENDLQKTQSQNTEKKEPQK